MTIIEVMISMSIIVIGLTVAFDAMFSSQTVNRRAESQAKAYEAIRAQIELYQYMPFSTLKQTFKGASFDVPGLTPPTTPQTKPGGAAWPADRGLPIGTVTRVSNPYVNDPDPVVNKFDNPDQILPLRFTVRWGDRTNEGSVSIDHTFVYRGAK